MMVSPSPSFLSVSDGNFRWLPPWAPLRTHRLASASQCDDTEVSTAMGVALQMDGLQWKLPSKTSWLVFFWGVLPWLRKALHLHIQNIPSPDVHHVPSGFTCFPRSRWIPQQKIPSKWPPSWRVADRTNAVWLVWTWDRNGYLSRSVNHKFDHGGCGECSGVLL